MAKYLQIDEILEKVGNKQKVKEYMSKGMTYEQAYQKAYPMSKYHAEHTTEKTGSWEEFVKDAGVASNVVKGIWRGVKKVFGKAKDTVKPVTDYAKDHKVLTTGLAVGSGLTGYNIQQYHKDMSTVKALQDSMKTNPKYTRADTDSLVTDINSRYKDLDGSRPVQTPYGEVYLPQEAFK